MIGWIVGGVLFGLIIGFFVGVKCTTDGFSSQLSSGYIGAKNKMYKLTLIEKGKDDVNHG